MNIINNRNKCDFATRNTKMTKSINNQSIKLVSYNFDEEILVPQGACLLKPTLIAIYIVILFTTHIFSMEETIRAFKKSR